ncbi:hypothetical protein ACGFXC_36705 [Streptomyces sp. NPDC048507]|uniref:hypothetical protein n=1 Tax=Streptomyces sp. NPDC048507 TaxID=3365560 RepID=UPI003721B65B
MAVKVIATLVWVAVFLGVEHLLQGNAWAEYTAVAVLCGAYAVMLDRISKKQAGGR